MKCLRWMTAGAMLATGVALACFNSPYIGVHFNEVVDFGAPPPPLVINYWEENAHRDVPNSRDLTATLDDRTLQKIDAEREAAIDAAYASESFGDITETRQLYREAFGIYIKHADDPSAPEKLTPNRIEFVRERLEILGLPNANQFMAAVPEPGTRKPINKELLTKLSNDSAVSPHACYVLASAMTGPRDVVASAFERAAVKGSTRREPALIMAARTLLSSAEPAPTPAQIDRARANLRSLLSEFPDTRFRWSALGWLARCDFLNGKRSDAVTGYLLQHRTARSLAERINSLASLKQAFAKLDAADAEAVRVAILKRGDLLQPYLDFRLYHGKPAELSPLAKFASDVLAANPNSKLEGEIEARLAEIAYQSKDYSTAISFARRSAAKPSVRQDLAVFVLASCQQRLGSIDEAISTIGGFEWKFPKSYLAHSAKELRALWAEAKGDWATAADTYQSLNYRYDLAYLLDIRMPIVALAKYNPSDPGIRDLVKYSYGLRLMRKSRFSEAVATFESIPAVVRQKMAYAGTSQFAWGVDKNSPVDRSTDPLESCVALQSLKEKAETTHSAEDLYNLSSYYYSHRNLLLYNAPAWEGSRSSYLGFFWNEHIATSSDNQAIAEHHNEHECLAVSRKLCLEIAAMNDSTYSPKALYRAACASRRLADFNPWWRRSNKQTDMSKSAINLMAQVQSKYPNDALAKNAAKYEKVFRDEAKGVAMAQLFVTDKG